MKNRPKSLIFLNHLTKFNKKQILIGKVLRDHCERYRIIVTKENNSINIDLFN